MATGLTQHACGRILRILAGQFSAAPASFTFGLGTASWDLDGTGGAEYAATNGYARQTVTFSGLIGGSGIVSAGPLVFPDPTGPWGAGGTWPVAGALFDDADNIWFVVDLDVPVENQHQPDAGNIITIGALELSLGDPDGDLALDGFTPGYPDFDVVDDGLPGDERQALMDYVFAFAVPPPPELWLAFFDGVTEIGDYDRLLVNSSPGSRWNSTPYQESVWTWLFWLADEAVPLTADPGIAHYNIRAMSDATGGTELAGWGFTGIVPSDFNTQFLLLLDKLALRIRNAPPP